MSKVSLEKIIKVADKAYNPKEHFILRAFKGEQTGDKLAEFIAAELKDTDSVTTAVQAIRMARNQLEEVGLNIIIKLKAL